MWFVVGVGWCVIVVVVCWIWFCVVWCLCVFVIWLGFWRCVCVGICCRFWCLVWWFWGCNWFCWLCCSIWWFLGRLWFCVWIVWCCFCCGVLGVCVWVCRCVGWVFCDWVVLYSVGLCLIVLCFWCGVSMVCLIGWFGWRFFEWNGVCWVVIGEGFFVKRNWVLFVFLCGSYNMLNVRGLGKER